jgi:hypothetical protein
VLLAVRSTADARLERARALCSDLRAAETDTNSVAPWVSWLHATSRVLLRYDKQRLQARDPALACATAGWQPDCIRSIFQGATWPAAGSTGPTAAGRAALRRARVSLAAEYRAGAARLAPVAGRELRVPLGLGVAVEAGLARARLEMCRIPPNDVACAARQRRRLRALAALRAVLRRALARAAPPPSPASVAAAADWAAAAERGRRGLEAAARMARAQGVPASLRAAAWHRLDALSAVVWKRALAAAAAPAAAAADLLLDADGRVQYVGGFRAGRFDGAGTLLRPGGGPAYAGGWRAGRMDGPGVLFDPSTARPVWVGRFRAGRPVPPPPGPFGLAR